jgi:hypothetical protein
VSDTLFGLSKCRGDCPTLLAKILTFVGQMGGYGIGIAANFVLQSLKSISKQYRISNAVKSGPGGI